MRFLSLDIETAHPKNSKQIISIAVSHGYKSDPLETESWQSHTNEAHILREFGQFYHWATPDIVFTWRGGGFDLPLLSERFRLNNLPIGLGRGGHNIITHPIAKQAAYSDQETLAIIPGRGHFDLALWAETSERVLTALKGEQVSLKNVARALGYQAISVDTNDMLKHSINELKEYNESDALVTYQIGMFALSELLFL